MLSTWASHDRDRRVAEKSFHGCRDSYFAPLRVKSIRVLFFAAAREAAGCEEIALPVEGEELSAAEFWKVLLEKFPGLQPLRSTVRIARNHEYLRDGQYLRPGDEAALIPPVSGG